MGSLKLWLERLITPNKSKTIDVDIGELCTAVQELQVREIAFLTCVNLVANAVSKCTFRTYIEGKEVEDKEHYLWNIDPNTNQSSTAFIHDLIGKLFIKNEALVIGTKNRGEIDSIVVTDDFEVKEKWPSKQNEYTNVRVGDLTYKKTFRENEVLHFYLNYKNMRPVINKIHTSYAKLISLSIKNIQFGKGQHWKAHIDQIDTAQENWLEALQETLKKQFSNFFNSENSVLPETQGYEYADVSKDMGGDTRDIKAMIDDIFDFTARAFCIPPILVRGEVADSKDAQNRFLTMCIDPICNQLEEEITRKRYGYEEWKKGNYLSIDTSSIGHFDMFDCAAAIDKLISSGGYSINDVRIAAGQTKIEEPWADQHFITKNYSTLDNVLNELKGEQID